MSKISNQIGRYNILAEIGRGTMGVVYKARDSKIDRTVAIKTIYLMGLSPAEEQEYRERFLDEARTAGRLSHPGIVTVFDVVGDLEDGNPYIVMEYVEGKSLSQLIEDSGGKLPFVPALRIAQEISEALHYAHSHRVVHRDIKPENILITPDGTAKIADFGIARLDQGHLTVAGRMLGSPAYMAPEQLEGGHIDVRSDIFSLGVVLYTMLTGHRPFQGNSTATVCFKLVNRDPLPISSWNLGFPLEIDELVARAMAKDPDSRFQTGMEMAHELEKLREAQKLMPQPLSGILRIIGQDDTESVMDAIPQDEAGDSPLSSANSPSATTATECPVQQHDQNVLPPGSKVQSQLHQSMQRRDLQTSGSSMSKYLFSAGALIIAVIAISKWDKTKHFSPVIGAISANTALMSPQPKHEIPQNSSIDTDLVKKDRVRAKLLSPPKTAAVSKNTKPEAHPSRPHVTIEADRAKDLPAKESEDLGTSESLNVNMVHLSDLNVSIEHTFQNAHASIFVDKRLVYDEDLHGEKKRHALVFSRTQGRQSGTITLVPGKHDIAVRVQSPTDGYDVSQNIARGFAPGSNTILLVKCDRRSKKLQLVLP